MILAAVLLALVACAPRPLATVADAPYKWTPVDPPVAPLTVSVSLFDVTYAFSSGELHRAIVDPASLATVADTPLGKGTDVNAIAGTASLVIEDDGGVAIVNGQGVRQKFGPPVSPLPVGASSATGTVYIGDRDWISIVGADGIVMRSFDAPRAKPGTPVLPTAYKGVLQPNGSQVSAFVFGAAGSLVAVSGSANSALVDMDSGARVDLIGFAPVVDVACDGTNAYVLGHDTTSLDRPFVLAEVDLATLDITRVRRFTVDQPVKTPEGERVLVTQRGDVYVYFAVPIADGGGAPVRSLLLRFDAAFAPDRARLPDDLGLDVVVGADGALYFFGGPAGNVVSRVDPMTRDITPYAVAPAGSYVRALIAR